MWTRKELKTQAKAALKRNYWKAVLVTMMAMVLMGGFSRSASMGSGFAAGSGKTDGGAIWDVVYGTLNEYLPGLVTVLVIIAVGAMLVSLAAAIFLGNPFAVGFAAFRMNAVRGTGSVGDLGRGYDASYKRNVATIFLMGLFSCLWSLLFVVPGVIKAYEYSMIPYLLADHPEMTRKEVFAASREMMKGNKWKAFVLDLSFILWRLLGTLTLGFVSVLYVNPYRHLTRAALYEKLKALRETTAAVNA